MSQTSPTFNPQALIDRLARFPHTLSAIISNFAPAETLWQPDDQSWSVLQIVSHLADEEAEDFPIRILSTLSDPAKPWPPIDPEAWAITRNYQSNNIQTQFTRFTDSRATNIQKLKAFQNPNWSNTHNHPSLGPMIASDLLAAWAAHDALHLRQLSKRLHQLTTYDAGQNATTRYAGNW